MTVLAALYLTVEGKEGGFHIRHLLVGMETGPVLVCVMQMVFDVLEVRAGNLP